jgi:hypothetical protein
MFAGTDAPAREDPVTMNRNTIPTFILAIMLAAGMRTAGQTNSDSDMCRALLPTTIQRALTKHFPGYRLPQLTDSLEEDVKYQRAQGGNGCLLVASGDFDGDGVIDFAVGLVSKRDASAFVVVVRRRGNNWLFSRLMKASTPAIQLYVATAKPDHFMRTRSSDRPLQPGERESMVCPHGAVIFGATESSGIAHCYLNGRWPYVWISD